MHEPFYVGPADIGQGVFAGRDFAAGDSIGYVSGQVFAEGDYTSNYCIDLGDDAVLEPAPPFRFLNHGCQPNCELVVWEGPQDALPEGQRVWVEATRPIRAGDELRIDYAWTAEHSIPCTCRSDQCRGWIVAADQLSLLKSHRPQR